MIEQSDQTDGTGSSRQKRQREDNGTSSMLLLENAGGGRPDSIRIIGAGDSRVPGYPATPSLFVLLLLAVVAFIALAHPVPALAGCALVLIGLPLYRVLLSRGAIR
jgi:hypothetical protein